MAEKPKMTDEQKAAALRVAQIKQAQGRGLKNSEITMLRAFERAQIRPPRPPVKATKIGEADTRTSPTTGKDTLQSSGGASNSSSGLEARIAALEQRLLGYVDQVIQTCDGTMTVLKK